MKTVSAAIQTILDQNLGTEPANIIEVQWVEDGSWYLYGDKDTDGVDGVILNIGTLESVVKLDSQGQTQSISVVLSDTTGDLKEIFNSNDFHGRPVKVSQWFEGIGVNERFLLYEGEVTSPIEWDEGERTLSINVITKLSDKEVGFSPEEGNFPYLPDELIGKTWPLCFGTVQNVPAVSLQNIPVTQIAEDVGIVDPSIAEQLNALAGQRIDLMVAFNYYILVLLQLAYNRDFGDTDAQRQAAASLYESVQGFISQIIQQITSLDAEVESLEAVLEDQESRQNNTIEILNGDTFPSGSIRLRLKDAELTGSLSGNTFTITNRKLFNYAAYVRAQSPFGFTHIDAGSKVTLELDQPIRYICNILPSTVHMVSAYKRTENDDILTVVPTKYYTVKQQNIGSYTVTYIELSRPLSSYDEAFQDEVYITQTSTVGPNVVDIIEWVIETYTDLAFDATSFAAVKTLIDNYPAHFALLERKNIFTFLEDLAFQSRCAIWISLNVFYIKYLSLEVDSVSTFTEDDVDAGSMKVYTSVAEELVTKLTATWTDDYADSEKHTLILRHNIKRYGTLERTIDFYIYNQQELVLKSATFWLIRFANVWKNIRIQTYLHKLAIETFDTIEFNFGQNFIANGVTKALVTGVTYDTDEKLLTLDAWVPIRFGEMSQYVYAWPSDIAITNLYPTFLDISVGYAGGDGPGSETEGIAWL